MATFNLSHYRQLKQLVAKKEFLITTYKDLFADPTSYISRVTGS